MTRTINVHLDTIIQAETGTLPDTCPNCDATLKWLSEDGHGVGECDRCAKYGAHDSDCRHAA